MLMLISKHQSRSPEPTNVMPRMIAMTVMLNVIQYHCVGMLNSLHSSMPLFHCTCKMELLKSKQSTVTNK